MLEFIRLFLTDSRYFLQHLPCVVFSLFVVGSIVLGTLADNKS